MSSTRPALPGSPQERELGVADTVQFFQPLRFEYLIVDLDENYTRTVIARNRRENAWIMSRTPTMPEAEYRRLSRQLAAWGYDTTQLVRVPQRW